MFLAWAHHWLPLLTCALLLAAPVLPGRTRAAIRVVEDRVQVDFPAQLTFHLAAHSPARITSVALRYGTNARTCLERTAREALAFEPAEAVDLDWTWELSRSGNLPPGAVVWWKWEIQDGAGETLLSEVRRVTLEDGGREWHALSQGDVTLYWSQGTPSFGARLLGLAARSLERLSREAGVTASGPVRLTIYPGAEAMQAASIALPGWSGGVAYPDYGSVVLAIAPEQENWAAVAIPHEIAHLVTETRIFNCRGGRLPTWLGEGLAVYAEGPPTSQERDRVDLALKTGGLPTLSRLAEGFAADTRRADLAYAQSGQVVRYLISHYGAEKMSDLLDAIQAGQTADAALLATYGLDSDGLDGAWRASLGYALPEAGAPAVEGATPIPTLALWAASPRPPPAPTQRATQPAAPTITPTATATPGPQDQDEGVSIALLSGGVGGGLAVLILAWLTVRALREMKEPR